jgi:gas vesicle protein
MSEGKGLSYFFLGLGVGVAVGIIFAPKSGEETRNLIRTKAGEGKDYVRRRSGEMRDAAGEMIDRGRDAVVRQRDSLSQAVEAGKQAYREAVSDPGPAGQAPAAGAGTQA